MRALLILLASVSIAFASQSEPTREELLQTVQHIQRLAKQQQTELDAAHQSETSLRTNLAGALGELSKAQEQLVDTQTEINKLAQHDANAVAKLTHVLHKYHVLKAIACAIAAAAAMFAVMQITGWIPIALLPYRLYLYPIAGVVAATLVATLL